MEQRGEGGAAIGAGAGAKIYILLYADDAAVVAEEGAELGKMLRTLERWADENWMEVSVEKTKIMIFRKGRRKSAESWKYKGKEVEIVKEFKYLGFWFTTRNTFEKQSRKLAGKAPMMINKGWGEMTRERLKNLRRRLYFMGATVKVAALYGVELWDWKRQEAIERVQKKYIKASMGLARNTSD
ncbi:uncharacterized protein LOC107045068 [Diachasma alloeum]|uniref:uncharacterized protein LOC107045068 n=1 Tax=Diachasma alloeum TaxID=454923 RepID=UPI0007384B8C|nr:uncharacterized protein LOC107045068 [Diachasma alloeum]